MQVYYYCYVISQIAYWSLLQLEKESTVTLKDVTKDLKTLDVTDIDQYR